MGSWSVCPGPAGSRRGSWDRHSTRLEALLCLVLGARRGPGARRNQPRACRCRDGILARSFSGAISGTVPLEVWEWVFPLCPNQSIKNRIPREIRSEEHTSELQSLMRISYAVFCLKKKKKTSEL